MSAGDEITTGNAGSCGSSTLRSGAEDRGGDAVPLTNLYLQCGRLPAGNHDFGKAIGRGTRIGFAFPWNLGQQEDHVVFRAGICGAGPARVRAGFAGARADGSAVFSGARGTVRRPDSALTT